MTTEAQRSADGTRRTTRRPPRRLEWKRGSARLGSATQEGLRAASDVRHLLGFRLSGLRGRARRAAPIALSVLGLITLFVSVAPAFVTYPGLARRDALILLPTAYISVLVISIVSAAASGGGRELLPREQAVAFPVSPTTDHLGALLMAPLNIAWLLQGWSVLGLTAYAVGPRPLLPVALVPVFLWLFAGTAMAQSLAWVVEYVRRGRRGSNVVRTAAVALGAVVAALIASDRLTPMLDSSPTLRVALAVLAGADGDWWTWAQFLVWLIGISVVAVVVGAWMAGHVASRPARDELRVESSRHPARQHPASDFVALVRTDRSGIWRSVPMRRGMVVLALFPGLVAMGGAFTWDKLSIFPGLVASGGVLLFGVNSWCLDGRGALWRDSLPVSPRLAFVSRVAVLIEILLVSIAVTLLLASLRAGVPTLSQLVSIVCVALVVTVQVVATSLRWSVRSPYAVDLRSSRATPAPPLVMVGYSSRLALSTTFTGLLFSVTSSLPWFYSIALAVPFLLWSAVKLLRTANRWSNPVERSRVIATVAS
ncbi:MAG: hypothetical protein ABIQ59_05990 [Nocardioidaceae bacterium]